jgi:hypothetical protein
VILKNCLRLLVYIVLIELECTQCTVQNYFFTSALEVVGWSSSRPGPFTAGKQTWYPLYSRKAPESVCTGGQNFGPPPLPTGIGIPDLPTRSDSNVKMNTVSCVLYYLEGRCLECNMWCYHWIRLGLLRGTTKHLTSDGVQASIGTCGLRIANQERYTQVSDVY